MSAEPPPGLVMGSPLRYDLVMWARARGRERRFRRELVELAQLAEGERVLDLGCGTGSLALEAARAVGGEGAVAGIDASPAMIGRARRKARRAGLDVRFEVGAAQELPLAAGSVDVVTAVLVLHHLPHDALLETLRGVRRVLVPRGRLLAVDLDLDDPRNPRRSPHAHARRIGARFDLADVAHRAAHAGLALVEEGSVGFRLSGLERLRYALLAAPA
ncbi:MAG TPA: class I SAM-dependent methyltransferase [Gaiellaceae bacterium]|nr:class I SAM-dependent methyltransferase [Gaiellaceae bacterium]